ncbi:hypothetical protein DX980_18440 [Burkholderia gladioli]|uniref:hypothetical protein n=1 Tax=Burkholderia gladioli TaxID=28095 RepID=UPI001364B36A|nr:hypothetical protein [Burkholderia gladioli]KAF1064929.1 hypothetical protein LvStA_03600 [Burkholderia gladioli]WAG21048.1 hypothetical protein DX980_18440 [Burkholderia gladioli]
MTAHLYFDMSDVPPAVANRATRQIELGTGRTLIIFPEHAIGGQEVEGGEIEVPFPCSEDVRGWIVNWLMYWGIPFRVLP